MLLAIYILQLMPSMTIEMSPTEEYCNILFHRKGSTTFIYCTTWCFITNSATILVRKKLKPEYSVWSKIRFKHGLKDITFRTEHKLLFKLNLLHLKSSEHALKYLKWGHTCCDLTIYTQRVFMLLLNLIYKYTYVILIPLNFS